MVKDIAIGVYKLTREDVPNPAKDGRSKDWNKLPVFPKGTYIVREYCGQVEIYKMGTRNYDAIRHPPDRGEDDGFEKDRGRWNNVVENLEPVAEPDVYDLLALHKIESYNADDILYWLVKQGKIGFEDIKAAYEAYLASYED